MEDYVLSLSIVVTAVLSLRMGELDQMPAKVPCMAHTICNQKCEEVMKNPENVPETTTGNRH